MAGSISCYLAFVSRAGGLPDAPPVAVGSEAELRAELERVAALLAPHVDWTQRCEALLRLEGLARGGAADWPLFPELLGGLRDVLAAQARRSWRRRVLLVLGSC